MSRKKPRGLRLPPGVAPAGSGRRSQEGGAGRAPRELAAGGLRGRWAGRVLMAVLAPLLFLGTFELVLRLSGYGYDPGFFVPDPEKRDHFLVNGQFGRRFFPSALVRTAQPARVAVPKPRGGLRVVVFGGSAAMGDPEPAFGFPRILETLLQARFPDRPVEVINTAMTAINSHVVLEIARDCEALEADFWVVYLGNNEVHGPFGCGTVFGAQTPPRWVIRGNVALKRTRTGQLLQSVFEKVPGKAPASWGGMEMFLEQRVAADDPRLDRVYAHLRRNVEEIAALGMDFGAEVLIGTAAVDLRDCAPFASGLPEGLSREERARWNQVFNGAVAAQTRGNHEEALSGLRLAASISDRHAELQHRLGILKLEGGRATEAAVHFEAARDLDLLRFRADSRINALLREAARAARASHLVDIESVLREARPGGTPGEEWFYEHVHFRMAGNDLVARLFASQIDALAGNGASRSQRPPWPEPGECARSLGFTRWHEWELLRHMQKRLAQPPFSAQWNREERHRRLQREEETLRSDVTPDLLAEAVALYAERVNARPEDLFLREQYAPLLAAAGRSEDALGQWEAVTRMFPSHFAGWHQLGALLNRQRRWAEAETPLRRCLELQSAYPPALNSLGIALSHLERLEEACEAFESAVKADPVYAEAFHNWGLVLARRGDGNGAMGLYGRAVAARPDYLPAQQSLGEALIKAGRHSEAEEPYRQVARRLARDPSARVKPRAVAPETGPERRRGGRAARSAFAGSGERSGPASTPCPRGGLAGQMRSALASK
ncbi:MAG TPA: tetratricopeptide repeat protein [Verrucomicrobiales bacterium]|nr:tetratricopeptide repeat protein [Verrucomicrobiales bacterium]